MCVISTNEMWKSEQPPPNLNPTPSYPHPHPPPSISPSSTPLQSGFVDTRQLHSINGSMWSAFEDSSAILLFACHQWLGMSALRNKKPSPALSLLAAFFLSLRSSFFPPLFFLSRHLEAEAEAQIYLYLVTYLDIIFLVDEPISS